MLTVAKIGGFVKGVKERHPCRSFTLEFTTQTPTKTYGFCMVTSRVHAAIHA